MQTYIVAIDPNTGVASGSPTLLSTGFNGTNNGQNDLGNAVSNHGTIAAFGGAVLALNFDNGTQPQVNGNTVKFFGGSITAYNATNETLTLTVSVTDGTLAPAATLPPTVSILQASPTTFEISGSLTDLDTVVQNGVIYTSNSLSGPYGGTITVTLTDTHGDTAANTTDFAVDSASNISTSGGNGTGQY